jgi:predicted small secreted protein
MSLSNAKVFKDVRMFLSRSFLIYKAENYIEMKIHPRVYSIGIKRVKIQVMQILIE